MGLSDAQTYGLIVSVLELLMKQASVFEKGGMKVAEVRAYVERCLNDAVAANEYQEAKKRESKAATEAYLPLKRKAYLAASGALDMAIAAVGKGTSQARNLRALRSRIRRMTDEAGPLAVSPAQ